MADLSVDVVGLQTLASTLERVKDGLDRTRDVIDDAESELGSNDLANALDDFEDHWDDGRGRIKKNIDGTVEALTQSAQAYIDTDVELAAAFDEKPDAG